MGDSRFEGISVRSSFVNSEKNSGETESGGNVELIPTRKNCGEKRRKLQTNKPIGERE